MNPVIEMLRGMAAWMVLTCHYAHFLMPGPSLLTFMWTGVDLFFVISGFVFGAVIFSGSLPIIPYAIRRLFRIYPLFLFSLLLYYFFTPDDPNKTIYFIKHLFFLGTTSSAQEAFFFNPAYWSLPVEAEYYFLLPLLALLIMRRLSIFLVLIAFALLIRLAIIADASSFSATPPNFLGILKVHLPGILFEFLLGALVYWVYQHARQHMNWLSSATILISGILIWIALGWFFVKHGHEANDSLIYRAYFNFACAIAYSFIMLGLLVLISSYQHRYFILIAGWLGSLSFGVYLFHILILRIYENSELSLPGPLAYMLCATGVVMLSAIAHYTVEKPMRQFGRNLARRCSPA